MVSFHKKILSVSKSEGEIFNSPPSAKSFVPLVSVIKKSSPTSVAQAKDLYLQTGDTIVKELCGGASGALVYLIQDSDSNLKVRKLKLNSDHGHSSKNVLEEPHWISYVAGITEHVSLELNETRRIATNIYTQMSNFYPKIYALGELETSCTNSSGTNVHHPIGVFYDQEYLPGNLAIDGLHRESLSARNYFKAITPWIDLLSTSWESEYAVTLSKDEGATEFDTIYVERCLSRMKSDPRCDSTHITLNRLFTSPWIRIDQIDCRNPFDVLRSIQNDPKLKDEFSLQKMIPHLHGDATPQNTIISESGQAKLFDPRINEGWRDNVDMLRNNDMFELMKIGFGPYLYAMMNKVLSFTEVPIDHCQRPDKSSSVEFPTYTSHFSVDDDHPFVSWINLFVSHLKNTPKFMSTIGTSPNWELQLRSVIAIQGLADITYRANETDMIKDFLFACLYLHKTLDVSATV
ncbi:hypothetical protein HOH45_05385 [bacterium]|nr:hypothetical protein [bacterium]